MSIDEFNLGGLAGVLSSGSSSNNSGSSNNNNNNSNSFNASSSSASSLLLQMGGGSGGVGGGGGGTTPILGLVEWSRVFLSFRISSDEREKTLATLQINADVLVDQLLIFLRSPMSEKREDLLFRMNLLVFLQGRMHSNLLSPFFESLFKIPFFDSYSRNARNRERVVLVGGRKEDGAGVHGAEQHPQRQSHYRE